MGIAVIATTIFVNLSNHRISNWSNKQLEAAKRYGTIIDIPFPNIPPHANEEEIIEMAHDAFFNILHIAQYNNLDVLNLQDYDITIHCMGEISFVWYIVAEARKWSDNIHCVVSTTERNVVENTVDGVTTKTATFEFVKFREII